MIDRVSVAWNTGGNRKGLLLDSYLLFTLSRIVQARGVATAHYVAVQLMRTAKAPEVALANLKVCLRSRKISLVPHLRDAIDIYCNTS